MNHWLKEPLLHFLLIGALLFGLYSLLNPQETGVADNKIVVSSQDIERLSANWGNKRNRPPTDDELQVLIESFIREEIYYREALALGLDQNDTILRRRMVQKMEFLSADLADLSQPDEAALNQYYLENRGKYELPARISFGHVYFSLDKHGGRVLDAAEEVLSEIRSSSASVINASDRGDQFMLPYEFTLEDKFELVRLFGQDFADRIFQLDPGTWQGPVLSEYGQHLVRIDKKIEAKLPELATVIDKVRTDLLFEQRQNLNKEIYKRFRERYEIVVEAIQGRSETVKVTAEGGKSS